MLIDRVITNFPTLTDIEGVFDVQNVADYVFADTNQYEGHVYECYSYRLPFPMTWFEFRVPHIMRYGSEVHRLSAARPRVGCLAMQIPSKDMENAIQFAFWFEWEKDIPIYLGNVTVQLNDDFTFKKGSPMPAIVVNEYLDRITAANNDVSLGTLPIITHTLNFLHCKNVHIQKHPVSKRLVKANMRRGKTRPYFEKYYSIAIEPMKKVLNEEGMAEKTGLIKAFHICRGHFKTYDEKPLFGKIKGTFWTSPHAKGKISKGAIKKHYTIKCQ